MQWVRFQHSNTSTSLLHTWCLIVDTQKLVHPNEIPAQSHIVWKLYLGPPDGSLRKLGKTRANLSVFQRSFRISTGLNTRGNVSQYHIHQKAKWTTGHTSLRKKDWTRGLNLNPREIQSQLLLAQLKLNQVMDERGRYLNPQHCNYWFYWRLIGIPIRAWKTSTLIPLV